MKHLVIDTILFALIIAELCFHYLPKDIHEILGLVLVTIAIIHFAVNFQRFLAQFNRMSPKKFFSIEVDVALALSVILILFTGLCMSNYLFPDLVNPTLRRNMTIHNLHTATPYVMTVLIGIHIGLRWREVKQKVLRLFRVEKLFKKWHFLFKAVILIVAVLGAFGLFLNSFLDRILMKHVFATAATALPAPLFIFLLVGSVIFFAVVTYFVNEKFSKL